MAESPFEGREPAGVAAGAPSLAAAVRTLGCKVNQAESEEIVAGLLGGGVALVPEGEADVVVVNTCTVTGEADVKARKAVRQALRATREPLVVVTGCLAATDPEGLRALGRRVVVERDKSNVSRVVMERLGAEKRLAGASGAVSGPRRGEGPRTRAMVKIEDGCDARCTYCIVPRARGVPRPVPLDDIRAQVEHLRDRGVAEVVLTGINLGRYRDGTADLAEVVSAVAETGIPRVRISSVEPRDLDGRLLGVLASLPNLCPHLHVPLQSGDDGVLAAMGRGYTAAEFLERVESAREAVPGLVVSTDVIVGFPGETADQADHTAEFCAEAGFCRLHVFRYSARDGTPAAALPRQVAPEVRSERAARLRVLDAELRRRHESSRVGEEADVLVEKSATDRRGGKTSGSPTDAVMEGTSEDYLRVRLPSLGARPGNVVRVRLTERADGFLIGERVRP